MKNKVWEICSKMEYKDSLSHAVCIAGQKDKEIEKLVLQWNEAHCQEEASRKRKEKIKRELQTYCNYLLMNLLDPQDPQSNEEF